MKLKKKLNMAYIFHLLGSLNLEELSQKGAVPGLNRKDVYEKTAAIPALNEQEKIAKLITEAQEFVNRLKEHLASINMLKKKLTNSFLSGELLTSKEEVN